MYIYIFKKAQTSLFFFLVVNIARIFFFLIFGLDPKMHRVELPRQAQSNISR